LIGAARLGGVRRPFLVLEMSTLKGLFAAVLVASLVMGASARADERQFIGVTEPIHDIRMILPVDGIVEHVSVKEGDWVDKDGVILALESRLETLEVDRRKLLLDDHSQLESIHARRQTLKSFLDSTRALYQKSGAVSEEEVKKLELENDEASAKEKELTASKAREQVEMDIARERRRQRILTAPISGVVTELHTDVGQRASTSDPVARIVDPKHCALVINVDEKYVRTLQKGGDIGFEVQAGDAWMPKTGKLASVSPVADPASRLVRIRIEFENADGRIWPGVAGRLKLSAP